MQEQLEMSVIFWIGIIFCCADGRQRSTSVRQRSTKMALYRPFYFSMSKYFTKNVILLYGRPVDKSRLFAINLTGSFSVYIHNAMKNKALIFCSQCCEMCRFLLGSIHNQMVSTGVSSYNFIPIKYFIFQRKKANFSSEILIKHCLNFQANIKRRLSCR